MTIYFYVIEFLQSFVNIAIVLTHDEKGKYTLIGGNEGNSLLGWLQGIFEELRTKVNFYQLFCLFVF